MTPPTQAIILAAGASTRTYPLTIQRPKPLLPILNQPLLQHHLEQLDGLVEEVILIVGFERQQIRQTFGDSFKRLKLTYCVQEKQLGTGHALLQTKSLVQDRFFLLNGDDLVHRHDLQRLMPYPYALLAQPVPDPRPFNILEVDQDGFVRQIIEKPKVFDQSSLSLVSIGMYLLQANVFEPLERLTLSPRGEYEVVDLITRLPNGARCNVVPLEKYWLPVGYPWKLLETNHVLLKEAALSNKLLDGSHLPLAGVSIKPPVLIGSGCTIEAGSTLGPNTIVGENCYIASGSILSNSLVMNNVKIGASCHLDATIIADGATIGEGCITLTQQAKGNPIFSAIKGQPYNTARTCLGAVIGRQTQLGAGCTLYPGVKLWPALKVRAGSVIEEDRDSGEKPNFTNQGEAGGVM